jgi:hypothetical protein
MTEEEEELFVIGFGRRDFVMDIENIRAEFIEKTIRLIGDVTIDIELDKGM